MPNNFKPDDNGQVAIPFHAHSTVLVDWSPDLDYEEIYEKAAHIVHRRQAHWQINDEHLAELQPEEETNP